jgi:predicted nucleic acid-binding protein
LTVYADSSFFASKYVQDIHSLEADRRMVQLPEVFLTAFNRAELTHAIYGQVFRGRISSAQAAAAWSLFEQDCLAGVWVPAQMPERTWDRCIELARRHVPALGVRTLDSLHVACAMELRAQRFWTFDDRQARLAEAVGLDTSA